MPHYVQARAAGQRMLKRWSSNRHPTLPSCRNTWADAHSQLWIRHHPITDDPMAVLHTGLDVSGTLWRNLMRVQSSSQEQEAFVGHKL